MPPCKREGQGTCRLWTHFSGGWLASEKLVIERAVRWVKPGLEKYAAVGYGLQRGRAFVREAEAYEELTYKQTETIFRMGASWMWNVSLGLLEWTGRKHRDTTGGIRWCGH